MAEIANKEIAVEVKNVSKEFVMLQNKNSTLKQAVVNIVRKNKKTVHQVLDDVSFKVYKGDFFGIVGRNGSGKSTLLKLIAGVYEPTAGNIYINGLLTPFIELGVGFNPELSGRDNVYLNGALLGFTHKQMEVMYDEIVAFAELEPFMDQKLKNYSSGMQVRLAFSVAIKAKGDVLILDEVLAVGDSAFQQKCFDYFAELKRQKKTVILVSHAMTQIQRFCNRAILIENGKIIRSDSVEKVASQYENLFIQDANKIIENDDQARGKFDTEKFKIEMNFIQDKVKVETVSALNPFSVAIKILPKRDMNRLNVGINIRDSFSNIVFSTDARLLNNQKEIEFKKDKVKTILFNIENYFTNGEYFVDLAVVDEDGDDNNKLLLKTTDFARFNLKGIKEHPHGMFHPTVKLEVVDN